MSDHKMDTNTTSEKPECLASGQKKQDSPPEIIFQLKIKMQDIEPLIWRCIQVKCNITLAELHQNIQDAMGWGDSHMHEFYKNSGKHQITFTTAANIEEYESFGLSGTYRNEEEYALCDVLQELEDTLLYMYDMGDGWMHDIVLESVFKPVGLLDQFPKCIGGARACPPENCGGVWGYQNLVRILAGPHDEKYKKIIEWLELVGYDKYDPELFDPTWVFFF